MAGILAFEDIAGVAGVTSAVIWIYNNVFSVHPAVHPTVRLSGLNLDELILNCGLWANCMTPVRPDI